MPQGVEITLPANQQLIAGPIGTVQEIASSSRVPLQAQSAIQIEVRKIVMRDLKTLQVRSKSECLSHCAEGVVQSR